MLKPQRISNSELFDCLEQGAILLTANLRLCRYLTQQFDLHALAREQAAWRTPAIMPLKDGLQQAWETLLIHAHVKPEVILNPQQETLLWENIIRHSPEGQILLRPHATARQAQQAWQLLHDWQLENAPDLHGHNEDSRAFQNWCAQFRSQCAANHWLSSAQIAGQISKAVGKHNPWAGQTLLLAGFDELTPLQQHLFSRLSQAGTDVRWRMPESRSGDRVLLECVDERDEIKHMARWARQQLTLNPDTSIAVVVPNLQPLRAAIEQILSLYLGHEAPRLFNISLGRALSQYPLVQSAFDLLALMQPRIDRATISRILVSPFVMGWERESDARALLDVRLRETGEAEIAPATLIYFATRQGEPGYCPQLGEQLVALRQFMDALPAKDYSGRWAEQISRYLKTAGWSCGRSLSSEEFQTLEAWRELLSAFARLDLVSEKISAHQALGHLRQLASEQTFQAESADAPLQVLGLYEASGLQFDALWLMGMTDNIWPATARPHPFIPLPLQRQHDMPHASAARELAVARSLSQRLLASANTVVVSYSVLGEAGETRRPSALFNDLPRRDKSALQVWQGPIWRDCIYQQQASELLAEDPAPEVDFESETIRGGSSIIRLQSNCPFRAFAELRLGARAFAETDMGLDALSRGTLVHRVLELIWDTLETQACLIKMDEDNRLPALVEAMSRVAVKEIQQPLPQSFAGEYLKLEQQRLQEHVMRWLDIEKQRAPFRVVETEQLIETRIEGIPIRLKLDRVDELEAGGYLVIDYKTGKVAAAQWFGERPEDPQLPLYASVIDAPLAGILFAQLQASELAFKGISEETGLVPKVKSYQEMKQTKELPSWSAVLDNWKTTVEKLASDFRAGKAQVDPLRQANTCRYCELSSLCRIHEHRGVQAQADEVTP